MRKDHPVRKWLAGFTAAAWAVIVCFMVLNCLAWLYWLLLEVRK